MKVHITNSYPNNINDSLICRQQKYAEAGKRLGFYEMGVYRYPVNTDSNGELSKRLDGVIASLEYGDVVLMQLPTGNGYEYENLLFNKIKAYRDTKIALIIHDMRYFYEPEEESLREKYLSLYGRADALVIPTATESARIQECVCKNVLFADNALVAEKIAGEKSEESDNLEGYKALCQKDIYAQKLLMDTVEMLFQEENNYVRAEVPVTDDEIQIAFGLYDKTGGYSVYVGIVMQSIIETTSSKICFHILHDETLNSDNREKLLQVAVNGGHRINFHLLKAELFDEVKEQTGHFTIGTMFRILLPEILPEMEKIIYLDADLLVNRDIRELWDVDISDYVLAAVVEECVKNYAASPYPVIKGEVSRECYFNAGVLYINLNKSREKGNMKDAVLGYLSENRGAMCPDQDALNVVYKNDTLLLDESWNKLVDIWQNKNEKMEAKIYHYAGTKSLLYYVNELELHYYEIVGRTPWKDTASKSMRHNALRRVVERGELLEMVLKSISLNGKKRIFYGEETRAMKNLYELLCVKEGDYRILQVPDRNENAILKCKSFDTLYEEESFVVFVLPQADNGKAIENLEKIGLKNQQDYLVIPCLLLPNKGGYA